MKEIFQGVFVDKNRLFTKGPISVYGEEVKNGFREWNPYRSKLAAAILNGLGKNPINRESNVLYLGASTGTTVSHVSDIVTEGHIYALEFSETSMRKLIRLSEKRENMSALLQDARRPESYQYLVGDVDVIYQDVAQSDQSEILRKNAEIFLESGDFALICIKARSIDTTKSPKKVFEGEREKLSERFEIIEETRLDPYDKDHTFLVLRLR
jgi:fibrillarin-like pre-rRNA processing protein